MNKKMSRIRRAKRTRMHIKRLCVPRLTVHRTPRHIRAQIVVSGDQGDKVLASASSLDKAIRARGYTGNIEAAKRVGQLLAERAVATGLKSVAFDRSGFQYHGRVKALADSAREAGMAF